MRRSRFAAFFVEKGNCVFGEHGIGITKSAFLPLEIDQPTLQLLRRRNFDPIMLAGFTHTQPLLHLHQQPG
jgi:FAD/FMN-containing dehydrogenase